MATSVRPEQSRIDEFIERARRNRLTKPALIIGAGLGAVVLVWRLATGRAAPRPATPPPSSAPDVTPTTDTLTRLFQQQTEMITGAFAQTASSISELGQSFSQGIQQLGQQQQAGIEAILNAIRSMPQPQPQPAPSPPPVVVQPTPPPSSPSPPPPPPPSSTQPPPSPTQPPPVEPSTNVIDQILAWVRQIAANALEPKALSNVDPSAPISGIEKRMLGIPAQENVFVRLNDPQNQWYWFETTRHYISHGFLEYWRNRGGMTAFGRPLTEEFRDPQSGKVMQVFEKAIFVWEPGSDPQNWDVKVYRI